MITSYDGQTKTATTATAWVHPPDGTSAYIITAETAAGQVRTAENSSLTLDMGASPTNDAYAGMTVTIVAAGRLSADFDPAADLAFLFTSQGSGQSRQVTGYDGLTRAATVKNKWQLVPDDTTCYLLTRTAERGTAQEGAATPSSSCRRSAAGSDSYEGMTITLTGGTGADQQGAVTAYDETTRTATVSPPWTVKPDDSSIYDITETVAQGKARGGDADHLFLAPDAPESLASEGITLTLVPDPGADLKRGEVRQALLGVRTGIEHIADVLSAADILQEGYARQGLAELLGTRPERLSALIPVAIQTADLADYLDELLTPGQGSRVPSNVADFVAALSRALVLSDTLQLSDAQARAVTEMPKAFNITDPRRLIFDDIISLSAFMELEQAFSDTGGRAARILPPTARHQRLRTRGRHQRPRSQGELSVRAHRLASRPDPRSQRALLAGCPRAEQL